MIKRNLNLFYLIVLTVLMHLSGCSDRGKTPAPTHPDELDIPQEEEYPKKDLP